MTSIFMKHRTRQAEPESPKSPTRSIKFILTKKAHAIPCCNSLSIGRTGLLPAKRISVRPYAPTSSILAVYTIHPMAKDILNYSCTIIDMCTCITALTTVKPGTHAVFLQMRLRLMFVIDVHAASCKVFLTTSRHRHQRRHRYSFAFVEHEKRCSLSNVRR